jgi:hypothetical protein
MRLTLPVLAGEDRLRIGGNLRYNVRRSVLREIQENAQGFNSNDDKGIVELGDTSADKLRDVGRVP